MYESNQLRGKKGGLFQRLGRAPTKELTHALRPPEPRAAELIYRSWVRAFWKLWAHAVRTELASVQQHGTTPDFAGRMYALLNGSGLNGVITRAGQSVCDLVARYMGSIFKRGAHVPAGVRLDAAEKPTRYRIMFEYHPGMMPEGRQPRGQVGGTFKTREAAERAIATRQADLHLGPVTNGTMTVEEVSAAVTTQAAGTFGLAERAIPRLKPFNAEQAAMIDKWRLENLRLIKNATDEHIAELFKVFKDAQEQGIAHSELAGMVDKVLNDGYQRAMLIASDQTTKFNGTIQRAQQTAAGIIEFVWSTSHDGAVRPTHRALDGKKFKWAVGAPDGPDLVLPGEPIRCRCQPIPVIELFAGLD